MPSLITFCQTYWRPIEKFHHWKKGYCTYFEFVDIPSSIHCVEEIISIFDCHRVKERLIILSQGKGAQAEYNDSHRKRKMDSINPVCSHDSSSTFDFGCGVSCISLLLQAYTDRHVVHTRVTGGLKFKNVANSNL